MKRLSPLMRLALLSIVILMIFGTISIIRGIIMLVLPLLKSAIGGELRKFLSLSALVSVLQLVLESFVGFSVKLGKKGGVVMRRRRISRRVSRRMFRRTARRTRRRNVRRSSRMRGGIRL